MGRIVAPYAVQGWVKIQPYTEYLDSLMEYGVWHLGRDGDWREYRLLEGKPHSHYLLAHLEGVDDRNAAEAIQGMDVAVNRDEFPEAEEGEYYWDDLIGLDVVNSEGVALGKVETLLETGAHDVLKVMGEREHLIPFVEVFIHEVDLKAGRIVVDWDPNF